jgi:hypothetical protein
VLVKPTPATFTDLAPHEAVRLLRTEAPASNAGRDVDAVPSAVRDGVIVDVGRPLGLGVRSFQNRDARPVGIGHVVAVHFAV